MWIYNNHMSKKFPLHPSQPEKRCWGCDLYCPAHDLQCGNGQTRMQHPSEALGDDWYEYGDWGIEIDPDDPSSGRFVDPKKANQKSRH